MNKQIPSINKILQFHQFRRNHELHESKVRNAKPTLTTRAQNPIKVNYQLNKTAKQPFGNSFSRMIEIQFENKALLKKLTQKNLPNTNLTTKIHTPSNPKLNQSNQHSLSPSSQQPQHFTHLNNNKKRYFQQHQRRLQNQGLLKRIQSIKPLYQMRKYVSERKVTEKYINSISKFGYKDYKPNKTILKFDMATARDQCSNSRKKPFVTYQEHTQRYQAIEDYEHSHEDKQNLFDFHELAQSRTQSKKLRKKHLDSIKTSKPQNPKQPQLEEFTQTSRQRPVFRQSLENNSSIMKKSQRSHSNSPSRLQSSFANILPQKQVRLNGKSFVIKGRQSISKLSLQILQQKQDKSIGNDYIHEVQIPIETYVKKFSGRFDVIIQNLNFDKKTQSFYIK